MGREALPLHTPEAFAVEVLQACRTVSDASALLGLSWDALQTIMDRAVERGLARREATPDPHLGLDEKSFGRGHDYGITNATSERFNSVIQALKYAARGFRSFANYRTRILFFCGKLDVKPHLPYH